MKAEQDTWSRHLAPGPDNSSICCRMVVLQAGRGRSLVMFSLFLGASSSVWPLASAVTEHSCPKCHPVETTICSGHCITKDPVIKIPFSNVYQHVCTYRDFHYKTFQLPDCPPGVDPVVSYPVALSCHCGRCAMDTSDCTFESLQPNFCMKDIPFYY